MASLHLFIAVVGLTAISATSNLLAQRDTSNLNRTPAGELSAMSLDEASIRVSNSVMKSVVRIRVPMSKTNLTRLQLFDEFMREYGRRFDIEEFEGYSTGSGVIVDPRGYVLTNYHVIDDVFEDSILVTTTDGVTYRARIAGIDPLTDLAVIRIYGRGFEPPRFSRENLVRIGQWVLAVGSPLGLRTTVTAGIVSAIGRGEIRPEEDERTIRSFIQTDAVVNPGNSGGGLFDLHGNLVGINTMIYSQTGYFLGYSFAIPADLAFSVAEDLIEDGVINRGYLGIVASEMSDSLKNYVRIDEITGVVVIEVDPDGPAARAGVQADDIIMSVNDHSVVDFRRLHSTLATFYSGDDVALRIWRNGNIVTPRVTLGAFDGLDTVAGAGVDPPGSLGVSTATIPDDFRAAHGGLRGAYITEIEPHGAAEHAGLIAGDILVDVDGTSLNGHEELDAMLSPRHAGEQLMVTIVRAGRRIEREVVLQPRIGTGK